MSARIASAVLDEMRLDRNSLDQLFVEARTTRVGSIARSATRCCAELYDLTKPAVAPQIVEVWRIE